MKHASQPTLATPGRGPFDPGPWSYALALGTVVVAAAARIALTGVLGNGFAFITFYPAVAIVGMLAGGRAGLLATVASALAAYWLIIAPETISAIEARTQAVSVALFIAAGMAMSATAGMLARAKQQERRHAERAREAEAAVRDRERLFTALLRATSQSVWTHRPGRKPSQQLEESHAAWWRNFTGQTEEEREANQGSGWLAAVHEEDREKAWQAWNRVTHGRAAVEAAFRVRHRELGWRWLLLRGVPIPDEAGGPPEWIGTITDITEQRTAEQALQESEAQFRALADSIANLAWWANADGYITWYNRQWYEYTGTTAQQMEGWGWQSVHDPQLLPQVLENWRSSIAKGERFEMEVPLRGANGQYRWFLTRVLPVRNAAGQVIRWFGTNTDVTELREARVVLARNKVELERLVKERTAKLHEVVAELEHFSYTITHDMRAPLRAMRGFAEAALELCAEPPTGHQRMFLGRIMTGAERMDMLITDALSYSKAVRSDLPLGPIDVTRLVRGMLDTYPEFQEVNGAIQVSPEIPTVLGNEAGLTQCFSNLLGNAIKFTKPGDAPAIRVRGEKREDWIRLWVEDKGVGIPAKMLPHVFDMFSKGSTPQAGTGIGLALVRKVVDRMGGRLGVESVPSEGSRFWIELRSGAAPFFGDAAATGL